MSPAITLTISVVLLGAAFVLCWWFAVRWDNYSIVDVAWALSFAPIACLYASALDGWWVRRLVIAVVVSPTTLHIQALRSPSSSSAPLIRRLSPLYLSELAI